MAKFRTKARAVELLGKGQIADLPTAISELWKNGYDAYADNLSCALYLKGYKHSERPLFVLADDGIGMSRNDLLEKWIVLGTDSKSRGIKPTREEDRLGKKPRIPMGEKGIGRLSVSYLGDQMLMLTKKIDQPCQALFIDWRVLENYNLFIDDLEIPIGEFGSDSEFNSCYRELLEVFESNLDISLWPEQQALRKKIITDLNDIELPNFFNEEILSGYLKNDSHGTSFIIFTPHEQLFELADFIDDTQKDKSTTTELRKSLSGLYNVMKGEQGFTTVFDVYNDAGKYNLLDEFFTPDDLKISDHYIKGKFDENGFFDGEVRVYNQIESYKFKPVRKPGKTPYGPFEIELGIIEGEKKSSKLSAEQYDYMNKKTELFGGLYIYRDGFRVLPYGRTDYDFLEFEKRRTKSAGYYFFSQRNMLGYISISRETNSQLIDKAGREGFITNKAYREFRDDLIQFFLDLSHSFFMNTKENETNLRNEQLKEIRKCNERILAAEAKKAKQTRKNFLEELSQKTPAIAILQKEIDNLYTELSEEAKQTEIHYNHYQQLAAQLEKKKDELRTLKIQKPQRAKITENQEKKLANYNESYNSVASRIQETDVLVYNIRQRFDTKNLQSEFLKKYNNGSRQVSLLIGEKKNRLTENYERLSNIFDEEKTSIINSLREQMQTVSVDSDKTKKEIQEAIQFVNNLIEQTKDQIDQTFNPLLNHLSNLNLEIDDDLLVGWYKEQNEKIEQKLEMTNELAQLGISIEIIDHQFNVMYAHIKESIEKFRGIVQENPEYQDCFDQLYTSYEHLANNHRLLVPLFRTRRRNRVIIKGTDIIAYLKSFFKTIFERNNISLTSDEAFDNYEFFSFESLIMSVFINVVNNAVYWLTPVNDRKIHLSVKNNQVLIMNNGEKIEDHYLEDIFTLFFSRRRDGRGIGLYLARTNLRSEGLDIIASNDKEYNKLNGACFIIKSYNK
ncbi:MAG: ATP-binding protein [Bacteroidales bacterium]|jgi:signal transduction histidine kinase|nr:ATP-binding protein [Bacteroidales bacterium]